MSLSLSDKFSQKGLKCPYVILTNFQKHEENVHRSFLQVFKNRRKISLGHSDIFSKKGGKCPMDILTKFQKRRKTSFCHFEKISKTGGKCS
jgi:hypothetical protein